MSDLARVLAFAFRRKGAQRLPGTELRLLLAYDLRWFAPEDAKRVVAKAVSAGLLVETDGELEPSFDLAAVEVPLNFKPGLSILDEDAPVGLPAPTRKLDPLVAAAEEERKRRGLMISGEVARLIVERRAGVDVAQRAAELEAAMLKS
jgi:hypothetical protein